MAFFEQIGKHITEAGQNVSQQTKKMTEITRLNSMISEKEKKISELYGKIGEVYYEAHKSDTDLPEQALIDEVNTLQAELAQCAEKVKTLKGIMKCPNCGADIPADAAFCSVCGQKIAQEEAPKPEQPEQKTCPVCGQPLKEGNMFCMHCGTKIENS